MEEVIISGLKCDYCDYRDDTIPFSDYKVSIGKPCPKCGNSLLTQEEYDKSVKLLKTMDVLNKIGKFLRWFNPFYYIRLIFKIKPKEYNLTYQFPKRKV